MSFSKERSPCSHQTLEEGWGSGGLRSPNPQHLSPAGQGPEIWGSQVGRGDLSQAQLGPGMWGH